MKDFIAEVAKVSPEYAPQLAAELGEGTALSMYAQQVESVGLDPNNVADNMAVWWLHAWEASAGRPINVPESAYGVVKRQVDQMLNNPQIAALSNADKQKMSDDFMLRTLIIASQLEQAKANPDLYRQLAGMCRKAREWLRIARSSETARLIKIFEECYSLEDLYAQEAELEKNEPYDLSKVAKSRPGKDLSESWPEYLEALRKKSDPNKRGASAKKTARP